MCVLLISRLLRGVGRWARKPVNHTSWVAVVTPTDRPKSVRNCCLIELFCGVVYVVTLSLWHFCWYRGFCHRTGSDLLLFVCISRFLCCNVRILKIEESFGIRMLFPKISAENVHSGYPYKQFWPKNQNSAMKASSNYAIFIVYQYA